MRWKFSAPGNDFSDVLHEVFFHIERVIYSLREGSHFTNQEHEEKAADDRVLLLWQGCRTGSEVRKVMEGLCKRGFWGRFEETEHRLSEPRCSKIQDQGQGMESVGRQCPQAGL